MDLIDQIRRDPKSRFILNRIEENIRSTSVDLSNEELNQEVLTLYLRFIEKTGKMILEGDLTNMGISPIIDRQGNKVVSDNDMMFLLDKFIEDLDGRTDKS